MARIFVGLGSNLGERLRYLERAISGMEILSKTRVLRRSSVYQTEPVGVKGQPEFLNMVVEVEATQAPLEFFGELKSIEKSLGRTRTIRWGPREIDLDLLYYGNIVQDFEALHLPHPEIARRRFVLIPLAEIAPDFIDPVRKIAVTELLRNCPDTNSVRKSAHMPTTHA